MRIFSRFLCHLLFSVLTLVVSVLAAIYLACSKRGRIRIFERFGIWRLNSDEKLIWFHAASIGELKGLIPVLAKFNQDKRACKILITLMSTNALDLAKQHADYVRLLPFDNLLFYLLATWRLKIKLFVFTETEIWPGLLSYLKWRGVPVVWVNARISDFSNARYRLFGFFLRPLLSTISYVAAVGQTSKSRLQALGIENGRVEVLGNSKYELAPRYLEQSASLKGLFFGNDKPTLVLGSIRPGEESIWFKALAQAQHEQVDFNLVVAPRHFEKFEFFRQRLKSFKIAFKNRSEMEANLNYQEGPKTLLLDSLGELEKVYSFAELVFVGGTIVNFGGHNPIEPAAYGAAICMGQCDSKISEISEALIARNALIRINSVEDAYQAIKLMITNQERIKELGQQARQVWSLQNSISARLVDKIRGLSQ